MKFTEVKSEGLNPTCDSMILKSQASEKMKGFGRLSERIRNERDLYKSKEVLIKVFFGQHLHKMYFKEKSCKNEGGLS